VLNIQLIDVIVHSLILVAETTGLLNSPWHDTPVNAKQIYKLSQALCSYVDSMASKERL